jgi:hypothetical protein
LDYAAFSWNVCFACQSISSFACRNHFNPIL